MIEHLRDDEQVTLPIATFDTSISENIDTLQIKLEPKQDFNGYDHPWVGGAGVNIIGDFGLSNTPRTGVVSGTKQADGSAYVLSGTASVQSDIYICPIAEHAIDVGDYILYAPTGTGINGTANYLYVSIYNGSTTRYVGTGGSNSSGSFTIASGESLKGIFIRVASGVNVTGKIVTPMLVKGTTAPTSYSPYENICPIYPANGVNLYPIKIGRDDFADNNSATHSTDSDVLTVNTATTRNSGAYTKSTSVMRTLFGLLVGTYTYSWYAKASRATQIVFGVTGKGQKAFDVTTEWRKFSLTAEFNNDGANYGFVVYKWTDDGVSDTVEVKDFQLERGALSEYVPYNAIGITRTGKNFFEVEERINDQTKPSGISTTGYTLFNNAVTISKDVSYYGRVFFSAQYLSVGTYTLSFKTSASGSGRVLTSVRKMVSPRADLVALTPLSVGSASASFTVSESTSVAISIQPETSATGTISITDIQIEVGSSATQYEPYTAERYYPISDTPIYGGTLDVTTGVLTVTHRMGVLTGAKISSASKEVGCDHLYRVQTTTSDAPWAGKVSGYPSPSELKCNWTGTIGDSYNTMASSNTDHAIAISGSDGKVVLISESSITSVADLRDKITATPVEVVYPLATPVTYQLTPQQIKTLIGTNNIWSDSGGILHVGYRAMTEPSDSDYGTEVLTPTEDKPYLWNYERITFTDDTHVDQEKHILAVYGSAGKSIQNVTEYYALSTGTTVPADSSFSTTVQIPTTTNKYVWNYEKITYTDKTEEYTEKRIIGVYGDKGVKGDTGPQGPQGNGYTYIEGTQTATTAAWTGVTTELSEIPKGTQILFHLNQTSAANVTLTLTLSNGTTFGPKNVFWKGTTRLGTHYPINSMVPLVYDGTQWYVTAPYTNDNNYDRTRYVNAVKLKTASSSYGIYVGSKDGYQEAASGVTFDINYPILYYATSSAVAAGGTSTNFYLQMPSVSLRETVAGLSLTANQMAYLVGTISGNTFTIDSAVLANAPTTADGKIYIPLGILYSAYQIYFQSSKELYRYDAVRGFGLIQNGTVLSVEKQYYLSTSNESPTGGSWGTTVPDIGTDTFLWTRDKMYYAYGDPGYTTPVCVTQYTSDIVQPAITSSTEASKKYASDLVTTEKATIMSAMSAYVQTSELNSYKEYLGTELQVRDDRISAAATKTELLQVKDDLGDVQEFKVEVGKYLTFDADNGLVLSALNSTVQSVITNSAWQLVTSGKVVQQVDATEGAQFSALVLKALSTGDIPTLTLGHLVISVESDGTVVGRKA